MDLLFSTRAHLTTIPSLLGRTVPAGIGTPATPALAGPLFSSLMGVVNINLLRSVSSR